MHLLPKSPAPPSPPLEPQSPASCMNGQTCTFPTLGFCGKIFSSSPSLPLSTLTCLLFWWHKSHPGGGEESVHKRERRRSSQRALSLSLSRTRTTNEPRRSSCANPHAAPNPKLRGREEDDGICVRTDKHDHRWPSSR